MVRMDEYDNKKLYIFAYKLCLNGENGWKWNDKKDIWVE